MAVAMQADSVSGRDDLASERGVAENLLANQEERRIDARAREDLEYRGGALRVGAVVERERIAMPAGRSVLDSQRSAERRP